MEEIKIFKSDINSDLIKLKGEYFVYHIINDGFVLYIGYSKNIYKRLKEHKYQKEFDSVLLFPASSLIECRILERADIFTLKPPCNITGKDRFEFPSDKVKLNISDLFINARLLNRV